MRRIFGAVALAVPLLCATACNLTSQSRVDSIHRMNEGIKQLKKENLSGAEQGLKEAIQLDPSHGLAHSTLGKLYRKQGKWVDAASAYQAAIANMGEAPNGSYHYDLGIVVAAQGDQPGTSVSERDGKRQAAIGSFQEAVKINPKLYKAQYRMGVLHEKLDQPKRADAAYRAAISLNAKYSSAFVSLGNMYIDYGFANVAMAVLDTGVKVNDTDAAMWNGLGRAYLSLKQAPKAIDAFKKAKAIDPDMPDVLFGLGMAYAELRQKTDAVENLEAFLKKANGVPEDTQRAARNTLARMQDVI
ncbi:MAG: tetratricopeptide repeat protein [Nannocystaceae bacterium]